MLPIPYPYIYSSWILAPCLLKTFKFRFCRFQAGCPIEYKWFSQGKYNVSNNIYRYTVAAIVGVLGTAAGNPAAGGLSALAGLIISERWPAVYWTRETWHYMQRNPSSPLYPNWTSAHKYKYYPNTILTAREPNILAALHI